MSLEYAETKLFRGAQGQDKKQQTQHDKSLKKSRKVGQQRNRDPECTSCTLGDLQNPTDNTLTNTSNHPCFVQGVRPEPCYIAQDARCPEHHSSKNFTQPQAKMLYQQNHSWCVISEARSASPVPSLVPPPNEATCNHQNIR